MAVNGSLMGCSRRTALRRAGAGGLALAFGHGRIPKVAAEALPRPVLEWFGAWSSSDAPRELAGLYAADGSFEDIPSGAFVLGPEIEDYVRARLTGLSNVNRDLRGCFAADGMAVAEQLYVATNQGFIPGAPVGVQFEIYAVTIFAYDGQSLTRSADYYDLSSIQAQLGVQASPSSPGQLDTPVLL